MGEEMWASIMVICCNYQYNNISIFNVISVVNIIQESRTLKTSVIVWRISVCRLGNLVSSAWYMKSKSWSLKILFLHTKCNKFMLKFTTSSKSSSFKQSAKVVNECIFKLLGTNHLILFLVSPSSILKQVRYPSSKCFNFSISVMLTYKVFPLRYFS